jgi:hypothetical protein
MPEFKSARLKIKRANEHIADANKRIELITSPEGQAAIIETDIQAGMQIIHYRLKHLDDLPDIALIVGDAIHNLRSALDHAWFKVVGALIPERVNRYTKFPIRQTVKELKASLKSHSIDTLHPGLFQFIIDDIKPYEAGDFFIFNLHELDITDKHKLLIPHANYGSIEGLKLHDDPLPYGSWGGEIKPSTVVRVPIKRKIEQTGRISVQIVFDEGSMKFMEVSEMLRVFSATIFNVVERLERFLGNA